MRATHQGITLWYGTPDAPAPTGTIDSGDGQCVVVGVSPAGPANAVTLRYHVDRGLDRLMRAVPLRVDHREGTQYFKACFPSLPPGAEVQYSVSARNGSRRAPAQADTRWESLDVPRSTTDAPTPEPEARLPFALDFLGRYTIDLGRPPEIIGATPDGIKVNWFPIGGTAHGPRLDAKLGPVSGDWMRIRPDGIGVMSVRATLVTSDGALISDSYGGVVDWGENGYENFLNHQLPTTARARHTPRMLTAHPDYLWLNRLQCIGIGEVLTRELVFVYDVYILS